MRISTYTKWAATLVFVALTADANSASLVGKWSCTTVNPNGSTVQEQWSMSSDGSILLVSGRTTLPLGSYHITSPSSFNVSAGSISLKVDIVEITATRLKMNSFSNNNKRRESSCDRI